MAKKLPRPHVRPTIDLTGHNKEWQAVPVETVVERDLIIDLGGVTEVIVGRSTVRVKFFSGNEKDYPKGESVAAFTRIR